MNAHIMAAIAPVVWLICFSGVASAQLPSNIPSDVGPDVPPFKVRPGYRVTRALPEKVPGMRDARFIEFSGDGKTLFLSQRREGSILALRDPDDRGVYKTVTTFVKDRPSA